MRGPQGEQGIQGESGSQGPVGPQGPRGFDGPAGTSVVGASINASGQLILTLSNSQTINAGTVTSTTGTTDDTDDTTSNTLTIDSLQGSTGFDLSTGTFEIGRSRGVASVRFTKTGTVVVGSLSVSGNQGQDFAGVNVGQTSPHSFTSFNIKRNTPGTIRFTLTSDTAGVENATKDYRHGAYIYMGGHTTSKNADLSADVSGFDNTAATAVHTAIKDQRKSLRSSTPSSAVTFSGNSDTAASGKFTYIIVPKQFGTISQILDKNDNPITSDFTRITENGGEYDIPNFAGTSNFTHKVFIYVSGEDRQLMPTDQVKISF